MIHRNKKFQSVLQQVIFEQTGETLDINFIHDEVESRIYELMERLKRLENLSQMIAGDIDVDEALQRLERQNEIDEEVFADDVIEMWEPLEYTFSVRQLLEAI